MSTKNYVIAILPNYYESNWDKNQVGFYQDENGVVFFGSLDEAKELVEKLYEETYYLSHGEAGAPDYKIIPEEVYDELQARWDSIDRYEWNNYDGDCNACGECDECLSWMIDQDREYVENNEI